MTEAETKSKPVAKSGSGAYTEPSGKTETSTTRRSSAATRTKTRSGRPRTASAPVDLLSLAKAADRAHDEILTLLAKSPRRSSQAATWGGWIAAPNSCSP